MRQNALSIVRTKEEAGEYLNNLESSISKLFAESSTEEFRLDSELLKIISFLEFLRYDERGGVHEEIIIDRETGFPIIMTFRGIYEAKKNAARGIEELEAELCLNNQKQTADINGIKEEQVPKARVRNIEGIVAELVKNKVYEFSEKTAERYSYVQDYYKKEEELLRRALYLGKLHDVDIFTADGCEKKIEQKGEYQDGRFISCEISLTGFNSSEGLFTKYILSLFIQKYGKFFQKFDENLPSQKFSNLLDTAFGHAPETIFELMMKEENIALQSVEKYTLGPYHDSETINSELKDITIGNGYILRAKKEAINHEVSYPFAKKGVLRIFGNQSKPVGAITQEKKHYLVCSANLYEQLDGMYKDCRVFKIDEAKGEEK